MVVDEKVLKSEIKNGTPAGTYLLWGDEDYMKKTYADGIGKAVAGDDPSFAGMNSYSFFYGEKDADFGELEDAFLAPPFMSDRKFIHISFVSLDSLKGKDLETFTELVGGYTDDDSVVTVISVYRDGLTRMRSWELPGFITEYGGNMKCVELKFREQKDLNTWIRNHFAVYGIGIDDGTARMITDLCGGEMWLLKGEIEKAGAYILEDGRTEVTPEDVVSCMSRTEQEDAFALANAAARGNAAEALYYLQLKSRKKEEPVYVLGQISKAFTNLCLARALIDEGKSVSDFMSSTKMGATSAKQYFSTARQTEAGFFDSIMKLCSDADRLVKLGGGYMPLERLVCLAGRRKR